MNEYDISAAFEAIEQELIASMIRNMDRHRAEELKEGYDWSMWQVEQLKALEKYKLENQKKYSKQFKNINAQIGELIWQARQQGGMKQEAQILRAIKNGFKSYKPASATMQAEFFKLNTRKLEVNPAGFTAATSNGTTAFESNQIRIARYSDGYTVANSIVANRSYNLTGYSNLAITVSTSGARQISISLSVSGFYGSVGPFTGTTTVYIPLVNANVTGTPTISVSHAGAGSVTTYITRIWLL